MKYIPVRSVKDAQSLFKDDSNFYQLTQDCIVYKKAYSEVDKDGFRSFVTIKLLLPIGTRMYVGPSKCRANQALVLEIKKIGKKELLPKAVSAHSLYECSSDGYTLFYYVPHELVKPEKSFCESDLTCGSGIHFFSTLKKARKYPL